MAKVLRILLSLLLFVQFTGCVARYRPGPVVYVPPPPPPMSYDEAVSRGMGECRTRSFSCALKSALPTGTGLWRVKLQVFAPARGHLYVDFDAQTRALVRIDEKVHGRGAPGRWEDD